MLCQSERTRSYWESGTNFTRIGQLDCNLTHTIIWIPKVLLNKTIKAKRHLYLKWKKKYQKPNAFPTTYQQFFFAQTVCIRKAFFLKQKWNRLILFFDFIVFGSIWILCIFNFCIFEKKYMIYNVCWKKNRTFFHLSINAFSILKLDSNDFNKLNGKQLLISAIGAEPSVTTEQ